MLLGLGLGAVAPAAASAISGSERSWTSPQETDSAQMAAQQLLMGFSPKPTPAPQPRGVFGRMDLMARLEGYTMGPATCGFVQSNGNSFTCVANTATCASVDGYIGCCQPNQQCTRIQTVCVDYAASKTGKCDLLSDYHTVCCSSTMPACYTYLMKKSGPGQDAGSTYTAVGCYSTSGTAALLDYDPAWSRTHSFPPSTTSSTSASTTSTTASQTATATQTGGGGGGGGGSTTNVGAIAGGAVGGAAALGLIGTAIFLLRRRNRKAKGSDTQNSPPPPPMAQSQPQSPPQGYPPSSPGVPQGYPSYSPPPQGYDPHMSVYSQQPYSPNSGYQQYPPGFQGQYPPQQQGGYPQYGAAGLPVSSTGSPPPHTTPSPIMVKEGETPSPHGTTPAPRGGTHHQQASELAAVAPLGKEGNRAELS
ncbi:Uncharacterized protein TPAR_00012 [Tolypocladium paradoxum]|uniref:Uncharacterized protein n=1 Tax=Tolypocladium paradoxum TaxID=94208 RepID=A0A2S4LBH9_9HYPO|nr:Uncharacterized protein TPAR_00012 [Tolypocladium paradoxum]